MKLRCQSVATFSLPVSRSAASSKLNRMLLARRPRFSGFLAPKKSSPDTGEWRKLGDRFRLHRLRLVRSRTLFFFVFCSSALQVPSTFYVKQRRNPQMNSLHRRIVFVFTSQTYFARLKVVQSPAGASETATIVQSFAQATTVFLHHSSETKERRASG